MEYTRDDYRKDLEIVALGADGMEAMDAKVRIRLYEAGRYEQLDAFINQKDEAEIAHDRLMEQIKSIYDDIDFYRQLWFNTPIENHDLWMVRKVEFERKEQAGRAQIAQLKKAYNEKFYSQKSGGKVRDALQWLIIPIIMCIIALLLILSGNGWLIVLGIFLGIQGLVFALSYFS